MVTTKAKIFQCGQPTTNAYQLVTTLAHNILDNSLVSIIYTQTLGSVDIREHTVAELCQAHVDKVYGLYSGTGQMVFNVALYVYEVARQHKTRREINNSKKRDM